MKRGTPRHPKTLLLAGVLKIPRYAAVGLLESLWHFGQSYAQDGNIGRYADEVIAEAIGWDGDAGKLIEALAQSVWVDRCQCHRLRIHDWPIHCDQTVKRWLTDNKKALLRCYDDASTTLAPSQPPSRAVPSLAKPSRAVVAASAAPAPPAKPKSEPSEFPATKAANVYLRHYPKGEPPGAMFKALRPLAVEHGWESVAPELEAYLERTAIDFHSWPKFAAGFGSWANGNVARAGPSVRMQEAEARAMASLQGGLKGDGSVMVGRVGAPAGLLPGADTDPGGRVREKPELPQVSGLPPGRSVGVRRQ